jgi:hypothetical protein
MAQIKLGELLVRANVLQEPQLQAALAEQQRWGGKLGEILIRMGLLSEDLLAKALSRQLGLPIANLDAIDALPPAARRKIPPQTVRDMGVLPLQLKDDGRTLLVAMTDPLNLQIQDDLRALTRCRIQVQIASRSALKRAFGRFYGEGGPEDESTEGFKLMDALGRTVVKVDPDLRAAQQAAQPRTKSSPAVAPPQPTRKDPAALLRQLEETQRKEVAALKAMVELLIEKRVFSRDEYLAKVKR